MRESLAEVERRKRVGFPDRKTAVSNILPKRTIIIIIIAYEAWTEISTPFLHGRTSVFGIARGSITLGSQFTRSKLKSRVIAPGKKESRKTTVNICHPLEKGVIACRGSRPPEETHSL